MVFFFFFNNNSECFQVARKYQLYTLQVQLSAGPCLSWWQVKLWRHKYHSWYLSPSSIYHWVGYIFPVLLSIALIVKAFNFHFSDLEVSMALISKCLIFFSDFGERQRVFVYFFLVFYRRCFGAPIRFHIHRISWPGRSYAHCKLSYKKATSPTTLQTKKYIIQILSGALV